jgi:hypothetical protein
VKTSAILGLSAALAAVGLLLLSTKPSPAPHPRTAVATAPAPATPAPATTDTQTPASPIPAAAATISTPVTAEASAADLGKALAPDDGPAGDHLVQAMLDAHSPHNLPPAVEQRLDQLGRAVFLADLIGQGRNRWPQYFTTAGASGYTSVRIQAAAARATAPNHAAVTLLWAGTSPAGDPEVGLPGTVLLAQQGNGTWEPVR